jgi:ATP-dependent DNA helicase RecQ
MYKSDWEDFLDESKLEDFFSEESDVIQIATIHKAKGKEFDNVFLLLDGLSMRNDENLRAVYVAMTRAKRNLEIHCNNDHFARYQMQAITYISDNQEYSKPEMLSLTLNMRYWNVILWPAINLHMLQ